MAERSPAFQFYPRDWDTDANVIPMTYEEEGVYFALCRRAWLDGSLPADLDELRALLKGKPTHKQMQRWWSKIGRCFDIRDNRIVHPRLERERTKQKQWADKSSDGGKKRAREAARDGGKFTSQPPATVPASHQPEPPANHQQADQPITSIAFASSSSSSFASASSERAGEIAPAPAKPRSLISGQASPMGYGKSHSSHVTGFCDFVCFPESLWFEFVARVENAGLSDADARVRTWANRIREQWRDRRDIPGENKFAFWENEWKNTHGSNRSSGGRDVTAGLRQVLS